MQQLRQVEIGYRGNVKTKEKSESLMLTRDQSIVDMQYAVQYRISDPKAWLLNNNPGREPDLIIRQASETAMRETVGRKDIDLCSTSKKKSSPKRR